MGKTSIERERATAAVGPAAKFEGNLSFYGRLLPQIRETETRFEERKCFEGGGGGGGGGSKRHIHQQFFVLLPQSGQPLDSGHLQGFHYLYLLMSSTTPHHTNCSPEPQDPCSINYLNLRYFERSESFCFILCLLVKIDI